MSAPAESLDRLYELLPAVYRMRDADRGHPLQALLRVIAAQVNEVEADIARLYDDWFIETCQEWVVPYIGDLVGYLALDDDGPVSRSEVANTIRLRRRKGTMALLEQLATDVSGWPSRAVEFYRSLAVMQNVDTRSPRRGQTLDVRQGSALLQLGSAFDATARTIDVRRASSHRATGRHGIPNVGFFVWRLRSYAVSRTQAGAVDPQGGSYLFSSLGNDVPLFARGSTTRTGAVVDVTDVPVPIRMRDFALRGTDGKIHANPSYYGERRSLCIWSGNPPTPIPIERIVPAHLKHWRYRPRHRDQVLVDPERGRMVFHDEPDGDVLVSYHYGFSTEVGGGEYERSLANPRDDFQVIRVQSPSGGVPVAPESYPTITAALEAAADSLSSHVVIEILDSSLYEERIVIEVGAQRSLQLRAAPGKRPVILIPDQRSRLDRLLVRLADGAQFTMDGLIVAGRAVRVRGADADEAPGLLIIRHCTLVPGWLLDERCEPSCMHEPSLELHDTNACVRIERSIVGSIFVRTDERRFDPVRLHVTDSIIDATDSRLLHDLKRDACRTYNAISDDDCETAHAVVTILRSTVIGDIRVHAISLAENSILFGSTIVARRQIGCIRFSYVGGGSRTPRRFHCQPDLVEQNVRALHAAQLLTDEQRDRRLAAEQLRVEPDFNSLRYGLPTYCQLAATCAEEITQGAADRSEMGVFHQLRQPQRTAALRARLDEYTPAGMDPGIIFAT